ncbi:ABC transporter ATP-binding protein [Jiangella asiatica]|uniref:ABC transporter ATP-binding protein n=1 Tax=Jiangella asiatica TaxID=2530372 RepID=A0A4R5DBT5_9ACTN|nr:ABC transporter ATP-binding protein [Jiangella asiatica]TDE11166.1 ABC transporter ATP-binding protein [Jiangella asiatica]
MNQPHSADHDPVLALHHGRVVYPGPAGSGFEAIRDVSVTLHAGEILGLVGESGSGKSTTARAMLGLTHLTSGSLTYRGQAVTWADRRFRSRVQAIFQNPAGSFNPKRSLLDSVAEPLRVWKRGTKEQRRKTALDALGQVGIPPEVAARRPNRVSGGQCQRAAIARAIVLEPEVLICDEPVSALDVSIQAQILELLARLRAERNLAMLFISHDLSVVSALCDRTAVMYAGEIVEEAPTLTIANAPTHPYAAILHDAAAAVTPGAAVGEPLVPRGAATVDGRHLAGCRFEEVCPRATQLCVTDHPELTGDEHAVACHHPIPVAPAENDVYVRSHPSGSAEGTTQRSARP